VKGKRTNRQSLHLTPNLLALRGETLEQQLHLFVVVGGSRAALQFGGEVEGGEVGVC
jgi:hypothetical protein